MALLAVLLLGINALALWGIFYAGGEARKAALEDLRLQTIANARSLEAVLASSRADFVFLSQSPPLADYREALNEPDPMRRRWRRLDMESTLLLFFAAHPEVESVVLREAKQGKAFLAAGRRDGAPVLEPAGDAPLSLQRREGFLTGMWPLGGSADPGWLEASLDVRKLLDIAAPTESSKLRVLQDDGGEQPTAGQSEDVYLISASVANSDWQPPLDWTLQRLEPRSGLVASISTLADRYRFTLILNLTLMVGALVLGVIAFRQARRSVVLEAENRHQAEVRELERQVLHQERLATIGQLAAGIAHEINNPLEGMSNYLSLLKEEIRDQRKEAALEMISKVREGLERASGITRQVLTFADPAQAPKSELEVEKVLDESIQFVRGNPAYRQAEIRFSPSGEGPWVLGNSVTLSQLFLNLLLNACQQPGEGETVEVACRVRGEEVMITIADQGPGIPEEVLPKIFEPFFSTRQSTGLGLSVCLGIARQHEGRLEAENRDGRGAAFTLYLPRLASASAPPQEQRRPFETSREAS
ncbi:MAG TPA: ATP-binding protein [Acidobacteriota bacterium]|nr:ATP-binding protein [Acidobacteriota bacterium]